MQEKSVGGKITVQFMQFTGLATWFYYPKQLNNALNVNYITEGRFFFTNARLNGRTRL